ncbi:hypothetical protein MTR67_005839 [Solanum verrucosum]|uniref:DUF7036 domain-containing protein n=1 Tax=Solanum verrucosum TaxID=315347 RepID=A0AAF0Q2W5_SOLVR|nr:hypothetical protein MTR67_005839 [Solanum verrucosum]
MGKLQGQRLPVQNQNSDGVGSTTFCQRCSMGFSRIGLQFSFKCIAVLLLSIALFLSAVFWILPHPSKLSGFDAKEAIKHAGSLCLFLKAIAGLLLQRVLMLLDLIVLSTTQAYFRLEKPVSDIVPHIARLEYDILEEIAIPNMKVSVLSVHAAGAANQTNVIFGFLPDPVDSSSTPVYLSLLKSALLELYLRDTNLTLTSSIFGQPSSFEVLKCPGGITMIPEHLPFWDLPDVLFNFTLHSSIDEIRENFIELKEQLISGLRLSQSESVFLQISNEVGSTKDPPVIVEASVYSDIGSLQPQRLKQLAQIIMGSVPKSNLGLDNSVFGKVKQVSLSSFLNRTVHASPPAPTPAPAPNEPLWPSPSPSPSVSSSPSPSPAPLSNCRRLQSHARHHCGPARGEEPSSSPSPIADPPSPVTSSGPPSSSSGIAASPSSHAPTYPPKLSPRVNLSPGPSPQMSSSISSSSSSLAPGFSYKELCLFWLFGLSVFHTLGWTW